MTVRRNQKFFYRLMEGEGRKIIVHMVFWGERRGISRRQQSIKGELLKIDNNGGWGGGGRKNSTELGPS